MSLYKYFEENANQVSGKIWIWVWKWSQKLSDYWEILTWVFLIEEVFWIFNLKLDNNNAINKKKY